MVWALGAMLRENQGNSGFPKTTQELCWGKGGAAQSCEVLIKFCLLLLYVDKKDMLMRLTSTTTSFSKNYRSLQSISSLIVMHMLFYSLQFMHSTKVYNFLVFFRDLAFFMFLSYWNSCPTWTWQTWNLLQQMP